MRISDTKQYNNKYYVAASEDGVLHRLSAYEKVCSGRHKYYYHYKSLAGVHGCVYLCVCGRGTVVIK